MLEKPGEVLEAGFGASTRNFKSAVDRNRIKRLMREAYRLQKDPLIGSLKQAKRQLAVFFIYTGSTLPEYRHVYARITAACKRLIKITDENTPADT